MDQDGEVLFEKRGRAGIITLNRPKALNALTLGMVRSMHPQLVGWAEDADVATVVVRAAGDRAFCAGGDIRQLHAWGLARDPAFLDFYREEYRLNTYIKRYPKPYVALIDGIVMGGGVGISVHGSHRAAGERTQFAMPETGIGLFPDVGGTHFLPRLPGEIGTWLALTGARLNQADAVWCGIASHAVSASSFEQIMEMLAEGMEADRAINAKSAPPAGAAALPSLRSVIDHCFSGDSVGDILARLDTETGAHQQWAQEQAAAIRTKSPTSLSIALRQMRLGARMSFEDCMKIEFRIVNRIAQGGDFFEGVRAIIIDKDNRPQWKPAGIGDISGAEIEGYFAGLENELDLSNLASM